MAKDLNRCIFQRAHTVAQQVHEKTLILTNYKVNTSNKTTIGITSHLLKWLLSKRQADVSWKGCEKKKGPSCTISEDANWHNLYGKWVRKFLRKLKVKITFYILTLSLYIYIGCIFEESEITIFERYLHLLCLLQHYWRSQDPEIP